MIRIMIIMILVMMIITIRQIYISMATSPVLIQFF